MFGFIRATLSETQQLQRLLNRWACLMFVLAAGYAMPAAAGLVLAPTLTVDVTVGSGYPAGLTDISPPVSREPFFAQGKIVLTVPVYDTGYAAGVDIYFGVIMPGGTRVKTWSPDNTGKITLNDGFAPIARAYSVSSPGTFDTRSANSGELITYTFNGSEEKGLYLVFIHMVPTGTVLIDVYGCAGAEMHPFFVK